MSYHANTFHSLKSQLESEESGELEKVIAIFSFRCLPIALANLALELFSTGSSFGRG